MNKRIKKKLRKRNGHMKYANVNTITVHFRSSVYRNPMIDAMAKHLSKIFIGCDLGHGEDFNGGTTLKFKPTDQMEGDNYEDNQSTK